MESIERVLSRISELTPAQQNELTAVLRKMRDGETVGMMKEEVFRKSLKRAYTALNDVLLLTGIEMEGEPVYLEKNENTIGVGAILSRMDDIATEIDYYLAPVKKEGVIHSDNGHYYLDDIYLSSGDILEVLTEDEEERPYWKKTAIEFNSAGDDYYFTRLPHHPVEGATVRIK